MNGKARPRVYISGPITKGDRNQNFAQAAAAEKQLMLNGMAPLNPMRSMIMPHAWDGELPHSVWLECDLPWVLMCDAVYRLPGESAGADEECQFADREGIPVFHSVDILMGHFGLMKEGETHDLAPVTIGTGANKISGWVPVGLSRGITVSDGDTVTNE